MEREDVILDLYRALRDSLLDGIYYTEREGNKILYYKNEKKMTISFRIKIEDHPRSKQEEYMP